jgi:RNA polymerase sigma factor for flagellar operon FliA
VALIRTDDALRAALWRRFLRRRRRRFRNELAEAYLPLVRRVAEDVAARVPRSVDPEDLFSVGVFGLIQSIESFDAARGVRFETFCRRRIRGAMIDELRGHDGLSRAARDRVRAVALARGRLRQELGREPNHHELAQHVRLRPSEIERILARASRTVLSLDRANGEASGSEQALNLADDLVDDRAEPPETALRNELLRLIDGTLSKEERDLLRMRYVDGLTMRKIGRRMGLSESRICQIHGRLLLKLHRRLAVDS